MDTKEIEKIIRIHITEFIGEKKIANNANLLDSSLGLYINDWLYIFTDLEKELKKPVCKILENMECTDFTIDCLSKRIVDLINMAI